MFESSKNSFNQTVEEEKSNSAAAAIGRCFVTGMKAGAFMGGVVIAVGVPWALVKRLSGTNNN